MPTIQRQILLVVVLTPRLETPAILLKGWIQAALQLWNSACAVRLGFLDLDLPFATSHSDTPYPGTDIDDSEDGWRRTGCAASGREGRREIPGTNRVWHVDVALLEASILRW